MPQEKNDPYDRERGRELQRGVSPKPPRKVKSIGSPTQDMHKIFRGGMQYKNESAFVMFHSYNSCHRTTGCGRWTDGCSRGWRRLHIQHSATPVATGLRIAAVGHDRCMASGGKCSAATMSRKQRAADLWWKAAPSLSHSLLCSPPFSHLLRGRKAPGSSVLCPPVHRCNSSVACPDEPRLHSLHSLDVSGTSGGLYCCSYGGGGIEGGLSWSDRRSGHACLSHRAGMEVQNLPLHAADLHPRHY